MPRPPKFTTVQSSISDAIETGLSELNELREEMESWRDSLEEKLSHTDKYQEVSACADALSTAEENVEIDDDEAGSVSVPVRLGHKRRSPRWLRRDNAVAYLSAARDGLENYASELRIAMAEGGDAEEDDEREDRAQALDDIVATLDNIISDAEGADFPAMY